MSSSYGKVVKSKKYEIYCRNCGAPYGFSNHHFKAGESLELHLITLPDGTQAKTPDQLYCCCSERVKPDIKIRESEHYTP